MKLKNFTKTRKFMRILEKSPNMLALRLKAEEINRTISKLFTQDLFVFPMEKTPEFHLYVSRDLLKNQVAVLAYIKEVASEKKLEEQIILKAIYDMVYQADISKIDTISRSKYVGLVTRTLTPEERMATYQYLDRPENKNPQNKITFEYENREMSSSSKKVI